DLSMPKLGGMDVLPLILRRHPSVRVLILTMQKDIHYCQKAVALGAAGYLLKDDAFEQLVKAMKAVIHNEQFISPSILHLVRDQVDPSQRGGRKKITTTVLSEREQQVLQLVASGLANKNIARQLNISIRTVEVHRSNLIRKLNIKTTAGLVRYAMEHAFLEESR
ncbi:MAG TPA: response regulator transcription factor, partial [Candidatus Bathyarchaeia archaeon]|nr:response regulator transcription factor [Candidatus Bathyarchaeia archaeon]